MSQEKVNPENISTDPLTRIRNPYTLSTTPAESSEADEIIVKHFLQTLAEIALAVASRKGKGVKQ
jgi:hypothetical protein